MFRRAKPDRAQRGAREGEVDGKQQDTSAGKSMGQHEEAKKEEEEEEEYPDNVECEDEYDEQDVYVMVELPSSVDAEALSSAEAVTIKVKLSTGCSCLRALFMLRGMLLLCGAACVVSSPAGFIRCVPR